MSRNELVFVCTGNMCRSPMAEYMLRYRLPDDAKWEVSSAGTMAAEGMDASANAVEALREIGIEMSKHRTRPVTADVLKQAAVVVAMARSHVDQLMALMPS